MKDTFVSKMKYRTKSANRVVGQAMRSTVSASAWISLFIVSAVPAGFSTVAVGQLQAATPNTGLINAAAAVFNASTEKGYVVDSDGGSIEVRNERTGVARSLRVGPHPVSVAVDSQNGRAYIVNAGDGTVSVVDGQTDAVVATLPVGDHPYSIACDSAAGKVYVTRTYSKLLMVIDAATNEVTSLPAGSPDLLVIHQKSHTIYLLSYEMGDLAILNGVTHAITRTSVGMHAWGMVMDQATGTVYIGKPGEGRIAVVEPGSIHPTYIETGGLPCSLAVNERTDTVYAADYSGNAVHVIDGRRKQVVATIPVGTRPEALAVDVDHDRVYVANTGEASISVIDGASNKVVRTEALDAAPYAMAANPAARNVYVATLGRRGSITLSDR